jgi:hypothetical protein
MDLLLSGAPMRAFLKSVLCLSRIGASARAFDLVRPRPTRRASTRRR